jgi:DivIVA domain-containing protein
MSELLLALTAVVLFLTVVAVVVLGRERPPGWAAPWAAAAGDGVRPERSSDSALVLPDPVAPEDLERVSFHVRRRGYDPHEVHAVLEHVARSLPAGSAGQDPRA